VEFDPERCYRAVLSRDRRFDGRFFTGVVTTGIYCRPVCPVVPPKFQNMRFYACAAAAEAAGFRPCKRCRPETAPGTPAWLGTSAVVSRGLRLIADGGLDDGDLDALAARLGIGERQLRRLFAQHLGASPFDVARARRVHFARTLIDQTDLAFAEIAHAAGFGSVRQFNHALKATFGEPPSALRGSRGAGALRGSRGASAPRGRRGASAPRARASTGAARDAGDARAAAGERTAAGLVVKLPFRPPLAWKAMLAFLAGRAIPGVESVTADSYRRTVEVGGTAGTIEVTLGPSAPAVTASSSPSARAKARQAAAPHHSAHLLMRVELPHCPNLIGVVERARRIFDLGADPARIAEQLRRDATLAPLVASLPGMRVPGAWDGFELAVRGVLGQQITVQGATTLAGRLVREFGTPLAAPQGDLTHVFPSASALVDADIARIGVPRSRAAALRNLAAAVLDGRLRFDAAQGLDEAVERICAIPGLGPWTAHYIAMRGLAEPDAFPESDIGIRRALGSATELAPISVVRRRAEAWRPWRSYAVIYLWNSLGAPASRNAGTTKVPLAKKSSGRAAPEEELVEEAS
jgi:AraC family transcriptional regulator of adaptative response / DNA-3-methyladenine glycosylase II